MTDQPDTAETPSTELARVEERPPARVDVDSWIPVVGQVAKLAEYLAPTEFVPKGLRDNPAATAAAILYGREVGLPPMASLTQTHVIEGRPSLSAEASRAKVVGAGHEIEVLETTGQICRMRARRSGSQRWTPEVIWTMDMARAAGLDQKKNWRANPRRMLQARCSGELCHLYFPDVLLGFAVTEELVDDLDGDQPAEPTSAPTTTVTRKRSPAKKAAKSRPAPGADRPPAVQGPPLPGEDGAPAPESRPPAPEPSGGDSEPAPDPSPDPDEQPADTPEPQTDELATVRAGKPMSKPQSRMLFAALGRLGVDLAEGGREQRLEIVSRLVGRPVDSSNGLRWGEASTLIDTLARCQTREHLDALLEHGVEPPPPDPAAADAEVDPEGDADVVDADVVEDTPEDDQ